MLTIVHPIASLYIIIMYTMMYSAMRVSVILHCFYFINMCRIRSTPSFLCNITHIDPVSEYIVRAKLTFITVRTRLGWYWWDICHYTYEIEADISWFPCPKIWYNCPHITKINIVKIIYKYVNIRSWIW